MLRPASITRKTLTVSSDQLVKTGYLEPQAPLLFVIQPAVLRVDLVAWIQNNRTKVEEELFRNGAILFRGFEIGSASRFEQLICAASSGELMEYRERSSPRSQVSGRIYSSTDHPADQVIFPHNEHSYSRTFPMKILFFCKRPATKGGETPIVDCRKVLTHISAETRARFLQKRWMYVRNFGDGFGLSWQTAFQTTNRVEVEEYCRRGDIQYEWKDHDRLRTRQVRSAIAVHPKTGVSVWFNHVAFFHVSTLEAETRNALLAEFKEDELPNNTYYGDGSEIGEDVLDEIREAYRRETIRFNWREEDVLMLDNMLTAHGRSAFVGKREVLVGMSEPFTRKSF